MSLEAVSDKFIEISGRPDLEPSQGAAVTSWWYINEAQKMLDRLLSEKKIYARYAVDVVAGQILVPIYGCRSIHRVECVDAETRWVLDKIDLDALREVYTEPKANMDSGEPLYYTPIVSRPYPHTQPSGDVTYTWILEEILDSAKRQTYNALVIMPPPDVTYTIDVWGLWYTERLTANDDTSFWTEEHEGVLLSAALYKLEGHYRNTEGMKDWKGQVDADVAELLKDAIDEEVCMINQMRG